MLTNKGNPRPFDGAMDENRQPNRFRNNSRTRVSLLTADGKECKDGNNWRHSSAVIAGQRSERLCFQILSGSLGQERR